MTTKKAPPSATTFLSPAAQAAAHAARKAHENRLREEEIVRQRTRPRDRGPQGHSYSKMRGRLLGS